MNKQATQKLILKCKIEFINEGCYDIIQIDQQIRMTGASSFNNKKISQQMSSYETYSLTRNGNIRSSLLLNCFSRNIIVIQYSK